jgi:hypothetical protein
MARPLLPPGSLNRAASSRLLQPLALERGEHLGRVLQLPGAGHHHAAGYGHVVVEIAVLEIELRSEVGQCVPAAHIVIDRHSRVPLRYVEYLAVACANVTRTPAERTGHREVVLDVDFQLATARHERMGEPDLHAGIGHDIVRFDQAARLL